jgi:hypothetical protein
MSLVFFGAMQAFKSIFSWPTDQLDVDEGIRLGVITTPAFFIHDRLIVGSLFYRPSNFLSSLLKLPIK